MKKFFGVFALSLMCYSLSQAQVVERGPYLQSVAQQSIKIMWRTDIALAGKVDVSLTLGGPAIRTVTETEDLTDHIVLVDGLQPNTRYYYRIGYQDGFFTPPAERYSFKTSHHGDQVSFWATGDFGSKNQKQIDVRDAFMDYVAPNYPDFWMWLGDNAYDDGKDYEFQERVFTPPYGYDSLLTFLPFYAVPGNHDYNSVNGFAPPPQHRGPYFDIVEVPRNGEAGGVPSNTELYYSFDYGNAHFVAINSEAFAYTFFPGSVMEEWLREDLRNSDKLWKIVYWHQPPYSKGSHNSDDFWEVFMKAMRNNYNPVVENFGVDMVICGHSHVYERSHLIKGHFGNSGSFQPSMFIDNEPPYQKYLDGPEPNYGTMYIVQGNSGKGHGDSPPDHPIFAANDKGDDACGSLLVEIDGNTLQGTYIKKDGTVGDEFTIIKSLLDSSVVTGVNPLFKDEVVVYPNPTSSLVHVEFSLKKQAMLSMNLYDMGGRSVYKGSTLRYGAGPHKETLNLQALGISKGSYILRIEGEGTIQEQILKLN